MVKTTYSNRVKKALHRLGILSWLAAIGLFYTVQNVQQQQDTEIRKQLIAQSKQATALLGEQLQHLVDGANQLANGLNEKPLADEEIRALIARVIENTHGAFRGGVVFKRDRFSTQHPLYSPFYQKGAANAQDQQISQCYDYTQPDKNQGDGPRTYWFHDPIEQGPMWLEPYYGTTANEWLAEYSLPFQSSYDGQTDNGYDGLVFANFSLAGLNRIVAQLDLGDTGFGFVLTQSGNIISYPDSEILGQNINEQAANSEILKTIRKYHTRGQISTLRHPISEQESWLLFHKIPGTKMLLGVVTNANELRRNGKVNWHYWYLITFLCVMGSGAFCCALRLPGSRNAIAIRISTFVSLLLVVSLLQLWALKNNSQPPERYARQVVDREGVTALLQREVTFQPGKSEKGLTLSIWIDSIDFIDSDDINLVGELWLDSSFPGLPPVYFPNATKTLWEPLNGSNRWKFVTNIKQPFDYGSFPFDTKEMTLSVAANHRANSPILIPAFEHYADMTPTETPGLDVDIIGLGDWDIQESYFSYRMRPDNHWAAVDPVKPALRNSATLQYKVLLKRQLVGPIISHIFPLLVVSFLVFCMLMLWTRQRDRQETWGFSPATVLKYCASLFFILVISHVSLRDSLNAKGMIFVEYFYFVTYLQLIFIAIAAILFTSHKRLRWIQHRDGAPIKLLYWPLYLAMAVVVSFF